MCFLVNGRSLTTKSIPKGMLTDIYHTTNPVPDFLTATSRCWKISKHNSSLDSRKLYRRSQSGKGWTGSPLKESSNGAPLTHDILDRLGALKQENCNSPEEFEEDLTAMQQRLIASGAGFVQRDNMSDSSSEVDQSPYFEQFSAKSPLFSDSFSFSQTQFPPTPPNQSPYPRTARTVPSRHQSSRQNISDCRAHVGRLRTTTVFDDNMNFINKFDPTADYNGLPPQMFQNAMAMHAMNPTLAMKDWADEEDFQRFFNPTLL